MNFLIGLLPIITKAFGFSIPPVLLAAILPMFEAGARISDAIRLGKTALDAVLAEMPAVTAVLTTIGKALFPNVNPSLAYVAAAQTLYDPISIKVAQAGLNALGQTPALDVDGIPGSKTKTAVAAFQTANPPLVADGWPGPKTNAAITAKVLALPVTA
jgi:Putative peptidoglycan binding domain